MASGAAASTAPASGPGAGASKRIPAGRKRAAMTAPAAAITAPIMQAASAPWKKAWRAASATALPDAAGRRDATWMAAPTEPRALADTAADRCMGATRCTRSWR